MTLILGLEDPDANRAIMVGDSGVWRGELRSASRTQKIWRSGSWLVGLAGAASLAVRIRRIELPLVPTPLQGYDELSVLLLDWSLDVLAVTAQHSLKLTEAEPDCKPQLPAIIVARGPWVWYAGGGEALGNKDGFATAGAPSDFADGALEALKRGGYTGLELARRAVEATASLSGNCMGPFHWLATDGTEGFWE